MARRRGRSRTRYVYRRARRGGYKSSKAGMSRVTGNVIDGVLTGVAQSLIPNNIPFADELAPIAVGWFRKNDTLMTLGGYSLGMKLASGFTGKGVGGGFTPQG